MAPPPWTLPQQQEFLASRQVDFVKAQDVTQPEFTLPNFKINVFRDFFAQWPTQEAEHAEWLTLSPQKKKGKKGLVPRTIPPLFATEALWAENRKTKIVTWFGNHPLKKRSRTGGKAKITISMNPVAQRVKSEAQIYANLYYEDRVRDTIDIDVLHGPKKTRLAGINLSISTAYANESEEVKAEVQKIRSEQKKRLEAERDLLFLKSKSGKVERTAEEYASAINLLPEMLREFAAKMEIFSGWSFTILAGGPDPESGGDVTSIAVHSCENSEGKSFGKAHPTFRDTFLVPFASYLEQVYPKDIRDKRSIDYVPPSGVGAKLDAQATEPHTSSLLPTGTAGTLAQTMTTDTHLDPAPSTQPPIAQPQSSDGQATAHETRDISERSTQLPFGPQGEDTTHHVIHTPPSLGRRTETLEPPLLPQLQMPIDVFGPTVRNASAGTSDTPQTNYFAFGNGMNPVDALQGETYFDADVLSANPGASSVDGAFSTPVALRSFLDRNAPSNWSLDMQDMQPQTGTANQDTYGQEIPPSPVRQTPNGGMPIMAHDLILPLPRPSSPVGPPPLSKSPEEPHATGGREQGSVENHPEPKGRSLRQRKAIPANETVNKWLDDAYTYLSNNEIDGTHWAACICDWLKFEKENGAVDTTSLRLPGSSYRPAELTKWLSSRKYQNPPQLSDVTEYANRWLTWWNNIQPQWRRSAESNQLPLSLTNSTGAKQNILSLRKTGPSGIVIVLISLKWWASIRGSDRRWESAVVDLHECIQNFMLGGKKRKASENSDDEAGPSNKTRKVV